MEEKILEALKNPETAKELDVAISDAMVSTLKKAGVDCTAEDIKDAMSASRDKISVDEMENLNAAKNKWVCYIFVAYSFWGEDL